MGTRTYFSSSYYHPEQNREKHTRGKGGRERRKKRGKREKAGTCRSEIKGQGGSGGGLKRQEVESRLRSLGIQNAT